jgi:hypothetical protein
MRKMVLNNQPLMLVAAGRKKGKGPSTSSNFGSSGTLAGIRVGTIQFFFNQYKCSSLEFLTFSTN